mmetsp:Transcript_90912/g.256802  ORF Transcript_90912/g.256802 Transcript_90912/m.256802 type:complete len:266 (-) Transcript_90912:79-876(-)
MAVASPFTITTFAPACLASGTIPATGYTANVLPTARRISHACAAASARAMSPGTRLWPKEMFAVLRMPPHLGQGGSASPSSTRRNTSPEKHQNSQPPPVAATGGREKSNQLCMLRRMQFTCRRLPWMVTNLLSGKPARSCNPSVFCVTQSSSFPCLYSSTIASCPGFGWSASKFQLFNQSQPLIRTFSSVSHASKSTRRCMLGSRVQTPLGPRKSGTPESVEMPAPLRTVIDRALQIQPRTSSNIGSAGALETLERVAVAGTPGF